MFRDRGDVLNANVLVMARKRVEPEMASVTIAANHPRPSMYQTNKMPELRSVTFC